MFGATAVVVMEARFNRFSAFHTINSEGLVKACLAIVESWQQRSVARIPDDNAGKLVVVPENGTVTFSPRVGAVGLSLGEGHP